MGLAVTELGDQGQVRRRVRPLPGEPPEHHPGMLGERPREVRPGEELLRVPVVFGSAAGDDLLERDGELVRVERTPLADLCPR